MADVAATLEDEGVASFAKSFDELMQTLSDKANALAAGLSRPGSGPTRRLPHHTSRHDPDETRRHMKIAMVGLGKMGANMTQRLIEHGHEVVAFDLSDEARGAAAAHRRRAGRHPGGAGRQARPPRGWPG